MTVSNRNQCIGKKLHLGFFVFDKDLSIDLTVRPIGSVFFLQTWRIESGKTTSEFCKHISRTQHLWFSSRGSWLTVGGFINRPLSWRIEVLKVFVEVVRFPISVFSFLALCYFMMNSKNKGRPNGWICCSCWTNDELFYKCFSSVKDDFCRKKDGNKCTNRGIFH